MTKEKFKVVHIIPTLGSGGAERMLTRTVSENDTIEHVVISLTDKGIFGKEIEEQNVKLITLNFGKNFHSLIKIFYLSRILCSEEPDVIITWLYHADLIGTLSTFFAGISRHKLFWNIRCSNIDLRQYKWTTRAAQKLLTITSFWPAGIIVNSFAGKSFHIQIGYKPQKWVYFPNGINTSEWRPNLNTRKRLRETLNIPESAFVFGLVARVDPMKDHAGFLIAARQILKEEKNIYFILAGRGTENIQIQPPFKHHIICLGERKDIKNLLQSFDVTVLCSKFGEGFPNVLMESMASGIPCISTDVGDASLILGPTGWLVAPNNTTELTSSFREALRTPTEKLRAMQKHGRNRIITKFQSKHVIRTLLCEIKDHVHNNIK